ncbi:unnamed protein product [Brassica rapa subsp. trilocularis]|uniref:(rape) hypothetical protein n=1 Tax=Brassica napus TaxID=3708 RepID=A0A816W3I9_BRANA|nr:unnamed protein product [Brassica napus]
MENQSALSQIWDYYPKHKLEVFLGMKAILMDEKRSFGYYVYYRAKERLGHLLTTE